MTLLGTAYRLLFVFAFFSPFVGAEQHCYFPDQTEASGFIPCDSTTNGTQQAASACCMDNGNSYCTDHGYCYENGLMSRGACTDVTWANPSCPQLCTDVVQWNWVNVFACDAVNFVCGTGQGRGDCTISNFTIPPQRILLRDDQQPNSQNGVAYTNRSINLVQASSALSTAPSLVTTTAAPTPCSTQATNHGTSAITVGSGVGIPLAILLLASLAVIVLQWRNLRRLKQNQNPGEAPNAALEDPEKKTMHVSRPYGTGIGELPTSFAGYETDGNKLVHELQSPISDPSTATTSTAPRSIVWNEASRVYTPA